MISLYVVTYTESGDTQFAFLYDGNISYHSVITAKAWGELQQKEQTVAVIPFEAITLLPDICFYEKGHKVACFFQFMYPIIVKPITSSFKDRVSDTLACHYVSHIDTESGETMYYDITHITLLTRDEQCHTSEIQQRNLLRRPVISCITRMINTVKCVSIPGNERKKNIA